MIGPGTARVRLEVMQAPAMPAPGYFAVQVGAFQVRANADRVRAEMEARYGSARLVLRPGDSALWRVLVGRATSIDDAGALATRIRADQEGSLGTPLVVRDDLELSMM
jgi:rare lipoprotein A